MQDVAKVIIEKGELQLTANERKEFVEKKRAEIGSRVRVTSAPTHRSPQ